ncbi:nitroreductase family protein [Streptococcus pseudoporcinus]|uniref:Nitroreductase family protein n=2 Tax=Streptococcus pseudoporcinus TaxID=361101 RepID=G5KAK5_9STRE|nr:nitroreductase family protein [Streptococcus pseudoporcinus]EFR44599.1 nitroreductase family protein [Streptococcus pseudoporcinus SPIN 20026]EHI65565.1 nitroreductase family protein [Streptococcus pseudoporcinus LQ 940-04]VEF93087.1 nitroreductase family protein [Streptococcus pseudoporcinus]VTS15636.1 nitroreductase family protein [Streptococcus pseudoporcinus]VUC67674.1 nitroreductase family protein [Streptococcus pseudoporcinus]
MKFLELNKKRHAVKSFNDKPVDYKDLRTAIEIATLAPSANNIQPWKFVVVKDKKADLAKDMVLGNKVQVEQAQYVVALFSDTDLIQRSRKIARVGVKSLPDDLIGYYMETLPPRYAKFDDLKRAEYLAFNSGLVAMNLVLALTDQHIASNMILGFDKTKTNDILDIDKRFRPEILITVGYTDDVVEPSYRLPVDELIERR